jgi:hypothetical protein
MILHKSLFLILLLALSVVPVLQTAHALTHFAHADADAIDTTTIDGIQDESDADADRACLDCLALTAFGVALPFLAFLFVARMLRQRLSFLQHRPILRNFSSPYLSRAPPLA